MLDSLYEGLKFKDAEYNEKTNCCVVNFLYNPDSFKVDSEKHDTILKNLTDLVGDFVKYEVKFISCPLDKHIIANYAYSTIVNNFPSLSKNFTYDDVSVDVNHMKVTITLKLSPSNYNYAVDLNRDTLIANKFKENFLADFEVKFCCKDDEIGEDNAIEKNMELMSSIKEAEEKTVYSISNVTDIIGKNDFALAIDFTKVATPIENVVICGEITNVQKKTYTKKIAKNGEDKQIEHAFVNFTIKNDNKFLYCSIFPKIADEVKLNLIEVGLHVCCHGIFREYNGKLNFTANSIARCEYKKEEIKSNFKHVNEDYHTVKPETYIDYEQADLFETEDKTFPGTYVVFDLETTGLEATKDAIIEIGACKIVDGKIRELFSTFVNPQRHIPKEITELTSITDEMVKDAPTINYVLPDFYKFCYNSTMVAHNIAFDIGFIHAISKKYAYKFDNPEMDTMEMARRKLPGLKNYKLGTIVERLNIKLDNAHRAINDATATAKVFIKLM